MPIVARELKNESLLHKKSVKDPTTILEKKIIIMPKIMQNLVVFMDPSHREYIIFEKDGTKLLNRFSIDEDAAFELSGVFYLKGMENGIDVFLNDFSCTTEYCRF